MYVEDTFPLSGPYRSTGGGVWTRTSGRNYTYANLHYEFNPDKTFLYTIKQKSNLRLSRRQFVHRTGGFPGHRRRWQPGLHGMFRRDGHPASILSRTRGPLRVTVNSE